MKSIFTIFAALMMLALGLTSCENPVDNGQNPPELPRLTIKNESSYVLTEVKFSGLSFAAAASAELPPTSQAVKQLSQDDLNKAGYISFVRKDIGIVCRTDAVLTLSDTDETFTFTDQTVVVEQGNTENRKSLAQITFISKLGIEYGGLNVARNDMVNLGEAITGSAPKQTEFVLKNTGVGKLLLNGNEPVKISGDNVSGVFSLVQPSSPEIAPGATLSFKITFTPQAAQVYNGTITVNTNDPSGDFSFTVNAAGVAPKPIIGVWNDTTEIAQNGTVNMGEVIIGRSGSIDLFIKNSGDEVLNIQNSQITVAGENPDMFSIASPPSANISPNEQSLFTVRFTPAAAGEKRATITIPNNDTSRPNAVFFVQASGKREYPVIEIKTNDTLVANNGEIDFGNVDRGTTKNLSFTLNNRGIIDLALTGTPALDISGSSAFTIAAQPSKNTVEPNDPVSFTVRFSPAAEGAQEATIGIACNTQTGYFSFKVTGTGYVKKPEIQVLDNTTELRPVTGVVNFGTAYITKTSTKTLTIKNNGDANLELSGDPLVSVTGTNADKFRVIQAPAHSIAPGSTTAFMVEFAPSTTGDISADVKIESNSRNNGELTFKLQARGETGYSAIRITNSSSTVINNNTGTLPFGNVDVNARKSLTFKIKNTGVIDLQLTNSTPVTLSGPDTFTVITQPKALLIPNEETSAVIQFLPVSEGAAQATVSIASNSRTNANYTFTLSGAGYVKRPQIQVQSEGAVVNSGNGRVDFGKITPNSNKILNLTIKNTGDAVLNLTGSPVVAITGVDASSFTITQQPNVSLAPGAETTFTVRFAPSTEKIYEAQVGIVSDSRTNSSFTFTLTGSVSTNIAPLAWLGTWIQQSATTSTSNPIEDNGSTWETLTITTSRGCNVTVRLTASSEADYDFGYASRLDWAQSTSDYRLRVSGTESQTTIYTVPAGTHYIHFGYVKDDSESENDDHVTVEIVSVDEHL